MSYYRTVPTRKGLQMRAGLGQRRIWEKVPEKSLAYDFMKCGKVLGFSILLFKIEFHCP
jgi:hypothetical protein